MTGTLRIISFHEVSDLGPMSYESSASCSRDIKNLQRAFICRLAMRGDHILAMVTDKIRNFVVFILSPSQGHSVVVCFVFTFHAKCQLASVNQWSIPEFHN